MTHRDHRNELEAETQVDSASLGSFPEILEFLAEHGFAGMAQAMQMLLNEAMKLERSQVLGAQPYQRTHERRGYANGFKPKTVDTRVGRLELAVPQTRGVAFYPTALERGTRSERALKLAVAEMYLQGVSTRKVTAVMEQLCGREVTSMQVSRAVETLDDELSKWRERPLGEIPYLLLDARYEKVRVGGAVVSCSLLIALGVTPDGDRNDPGSQRVAVGGGGPLARLPGNAASARLARRAVGHQRRSRRPAGCFAGAAAGCEVATLPVPPGPEPLRPSATERVAARGQRRFAGRVQCAQSRRGRSTAGSDGGKVRTGGQKAGGVAGSERARRFDRVRLPRRASAATADE